MAMESIVYSLADAYKGEMPPDNWKIWQPKKLLEIMLEIDPYCDHDSTIAIGLEEEPGQPSSTMRVIGTEVKLNLETLREHYNALGSYLHTPTIDQVEKGNCHDIGKLRSRCTLLMKKIEPVLQAAVFNCTMGEFTELNCGNCGSIVRKRVTHLTEGEQIRVRCFSCGLPYILKRIDHNFLWTEGTIKLECLYENCQAEIYLRSDQVKPNTLLTCPSCRQKLIFGISISKHI
jgi:hypothetical protein